MSNNLSIKEIAKKGGVTNATVSRVINKNGKVAKDTEKKILKVMEENNYVPNLLAKGFRTRKSTVIGIVVPDIANEFFSRIAQKVQMLFFEKGYATIICNTNEDYKLENQCLDMLQAQQVGGIIHIVSSTRKREKAVPMPTVYIDREPMYIKNDDVVVVESDNVSGGYQATKEMLEKGCKNILCLSPEHNVSTHKKRYLGYLKAIEEAGLESHLVYAGSISMEDGYEQTKKYFKENPTIDGVFATTDIIAIGAMKALKELNIKVPQEVKVFGYDDSEVALISTKTISTVRQPVDEMVEMAVNNLEKLIDEKEILDKKTVLPVEIIKRETTEAK